MCDSRNDNYPKVIAISSYGSLPYQYNYTKQIFNRIVKINNKNSLPGSLRRPVPLPPVLEPVRDLGSGEPGALGQLPLLAGGGVRIVSVPVSENLKM